MELPSTRFEVIAVASIKAAPIRSTRAIAAKDGATTASRKATASDVLNEAEAQKRTHGSGPALLVRRTTTIAVSKKIPVSRTTGVGQEMATIFGRVTLTIMAHRLPIAGGGVVQRIYVSVVRILEAIDTLGTWAVVSVIVRVVVLMRFRIRVVFMRIGTRSGGTCRYIMGGSIRRVVLRVHDQALEVDASTSPFRGGSAMDVNAGMRSEGAFLAFLCPAPCGSMASGVLRRLISVWGMTRGAKLLVSVVSVLRPSLRPT